MFTVKNLTVIIQTLFTFNFYSQESCPSPFTAFEADY